MKKILWTVYILGVSSCVTQMGDKKFSFEEDIFYTEAKSNRQAADLYIPNSISLDKPNPAVVLVHGGGWSGRDKEDMEPLGRSLVSNGFIVFSINYRFAPEHKHPAQVDDLDMALLFFKAEMKRRKISLGKIGMWGYSSGGHITSFYALTRASDSNKKIDAIVTGGTPFDLSWYPFSPIIKPFLGGYRDEIPQKYYDASPSNHITKEAPPFFIYHGKKDELLEHAQANKMEFKLKRAGIYVERYTVSWWGHVFTFAFSKEAIKRGIDFLSRKLK